MRCLSSLLLLLDHGPLELLGTLCNPLFKVPVELPDLFFYALALGDVTDDGEHEAASAAVRLVHRAYWAQGELDADVLAILPHGR
jgi:hypothetical protein